MRIVAIVGKAGSGKDTVAGMLEGAKQISFADPLKAFCAEVFGWDRETLWGDSSLRSVLDQRFGYTPAWIAALERFEAYAPGWVRNIFPECEDLAGDALQQWFFSTFAKAMGEGGLTPRYALQTLGTEWGRALRDDVWVQYGIHRAQNLGADFAVISDCRFPNEAALIREAGGEVWRIFRPGAGLAGLAGEHPSERYMFSPEMDVHVTAEINNSGTLEELRARVELRIKVAASEQSTSA
jgi:hypothetical protein